VIDPTTPNNKRWEPFKYLIKRFGLFKAIRTGLLLEAFITKKVENDEMYIDAIGVGDGFRGKGIGTLLLTEVEKLARQHGLNKLTLYVSCRNELAEALYTRFGFERVSIRKSKIAERLMNIPAFHLMVKVLK
jgi:ribosomal protein S18 acetylase RimI-like enzyme